MTHTKTQIGHPNRILNEITSLSRQQEKKPLVIFDLDSTLFDVSPRLEKVLLDIGDLPEILSRFPDAVPFLKNVKTLATDWGFIKVLKRAGVDPEHYELFELVRHYWKMKFFSNEYIHYDIPYQGAMDFVNKISLHRIPIVYLTGRDIHRMEKGSREVLHKWKFPLDDKNSQLILKPHQSMDDALFKKDWLGDINPESYSAIYLFENEPVNINLIRKELPHIKIVFFESTHSGIEHLNEEIPTLIHYLLDPEESPEES